MTDFLEFIRQRRAQLQKELAELDTAERVFRQSQGEDTLRTIISSPGQSRFEPRTIKQMVVRSLEEASSDGLTSSQILGHIQQSWMPSLQRPSLAPQLTRLRRDGAIYNDKRIWKLVVKEPALPAARQHKPTAATPELKETQIETEAPAVADAPETSGSGGVSERFIEPDLHPGERRDP